MSRLADDGFATVVTVPGRTSEKSLTEFLGMASNGDVDRQLRRDFDAIRDAERKAEQITATIRLT